MNLPGIDSNQQQASHRPQTPPPVLPAWGYFKRTSSSCRYAGGGWLGSRVVSVQGSGAEGPGFKSQPRR